MYCPHASPWGKSPCRRPIGNIAAQICLPSHLGHALQLLRGLWHLAYMQVHASRYNDIHAEKTATSEACKLELARHKSENEALSQLCSTSAWRSALMHASGTLCKCTSDQGDFLQARTIRGRVCGSDLLFARLRFNGLRRWGCVCMLVYGCSHQDAHACAACLFIAFVKPG